MTRSFTGDPIEMNSSEALEHEPVGLEIQRGDYQRGQPGGKAAFVNHSQVRLVGGNFTGSPGGDGGDFHYEEWYTHKPLYPYFPGASGGHGIVIRNNSIVEVTDVASQGGPGGDPEGKNGDAYFVDATSTLRFQTAIEEWSLY